MRLPSSLATLSLAATLLLPIATLAQSSHSAPVTFTADQDHQNMMTQLGIEALRPGPSGNPKAPDHANYDESKANPYPNLPDALTLNDGQKVTTAKMWWQQRRPQILHDFDEYVYGVVPKNVPAVTWSVVATEHEFVGFHPVIATELNGHVDNSAYPLISVNLRMTLVTPADAKGPVPVLMMFGRSEFPAPVQPSPEELSRINTALKALLVKQDPSLAPVIAQHPGWDPVRSVPFQFPQMNADGDPPNTWELIAAGWGFATIDPQSAQADNGAGLTRGIIGLVNKGQPRTPDQWGALRAWAWGCQPRSRLSRNQSRPSTPNTSASKASPATAKPPSSPWPTIRASPWSSSAPPVKEEPTPLRRNFGEAVENLTGTGEYHWMAGNFLKYGASKATSGSMNPSDIPVDSNELLALCAPRLTFVSYGIPEKGDAQWLDQRGSWMATVAASPVWTLLGAPGLSTDNLDYRTAPMPPVNDGLLGGKLAWRQDDGGHTDAPNMKYFIHWANKFIGYPDKE